MSPVNKAEAQVERLNTRTAYGLTPFQKKQIEMSDPVYIYNVSPIHEWPRNQQQLGTIIIKKRAWDAKISEPYILPGIIARQFDKGFGKKEWFLDDGMEVAEDICCCSSTYPTESAGNNLTNFGVFLTRIPFEELPVKEQARILAEANVKLQERVRQTILQADQFYANEIQKPWIAQIHRDCLNYLNEVTGKDEKRPWAPIAGESFTEQKTACPFCDHKNKTGVPKCANCHEIVDQDAYDKLKKKFKE